MSQIYAHTITGAPPDQWQTMRCHALAVANLAAQRGEKFGAAELARTAGLLHDIGKYSEEFQRRLRGEAVRVDHSTAGAQVAQRLYPGIGRLIAYAIAGHHAGLANGTGATNQRTSLESRLADRSIKAFDRWRCEIEVPARCALPQLQFHPNPQVARERGGFRAAFLTRMLYSCLVDADYLDTERFYDKVEGRARERGSWPQLADLKGVLEAYLRKLTEDAGRNGSTEVNQLRSKVLAEARAAAAFEPGVFTLTVPTGGGKTLSSLAFALEHAIRHGLDRAIYVIPFTSIIEQTAEVFRRALGEHASAVVEHHSAFSDESFLEAMRRLGNGEQGLEARDKLKLATENWDAPIIVTTAVQFFESMFAATPSKCRKLHNIARSVVILDEAQTLPVNLLKPCVAALDELVRNFRTSVVLCTATQPALKETADAERSFVGGFPEKEVREIASEPQALFEKLKRVTVTYLKEPLTDADLAQRLRGAEQVLCIVNTRRHARELFDLIKDAEGAMHLSALMCAEHRSQRLKAIKAALDPNDPRPCRVIATTVVEAGVDVDFPVVYRAVAGIDSIAQAAGRCNREGRLPERGQVLVFEPEGRRSIRELRANEDAAREVMRKPGVDALGLDAMESYFRRLYWGKTQGREDGLDRKSILARLNEQAHDGWIPFADIARDFQMIEGGMEPVIIPYDDEARDLLGKLETAERPGALVRKLQRYIVNVPRAASAELRRVGRVVPVQEHRFADQFLQLTEEGRRELYSEDLGLDWSDASFRKVESGIF